MLTPGRVGRLGSRAASSAQAPGGDRRPRGHVHGLPGAGSGSPRAPLGPGDVHGGWQRPPSGVPHSVLWGEAHTVSGVAAQWSGTEQLAGQRSARGGGACWGAQRLQGALAAARAETREPRVPASRFRVGCEAWAGCQPLSICKVGGGGVLRVVLVTCVTGEWPQQAGERVSSCLPSKNTDMITLLVNFSSF